jgi:hypothetical protein
MYLAVALWAVLAAAAGVKSFVQPWEHTVYPCFYHASLRWWAGESMYVGTGYQYTPAFAIANTPFALCGVSLGAALFNAFSIALLVAAIVVLARDVLPGQRRAAGVSLLLVLTLAGALRGVWATQSNALVIALVLLAAAAILRERWWPAAWLLAAAVFIKLWPIAVVMLLVCCWPRRLWWRFGLACLALAAAPLLMQLPQTAAWQYAEYAAMLGRLTHIRPGGYRDAWTIVEQFVEPNRRAYLAAQLLSALAVLAFCLWRRRRAPAPRHAMTALLCAWAGWQLLFGPGSERLTYGIIVPLSSWAVIECFSARRLRALALSAWLLIVVLGSGVAERVLASVVWGAPAMQPLGVMVFLVWLIAHEIVIDAAARRAAPQLEQDEPSSPAIAAKSAA